MTREFSAWLRGQMERREWGVTRLARELGVSHGLVSQWLSGDRNPSPASLDRIADRLVADYDELLALAGHRPRSSEVDPDAPSEQLAAMVRRVEWTPDRYETMRSILSGWLERDRQAEREEAERDGRQ